MKETYHLFADNEYKDEYGLPKLHFRTQVTNLNADWTSLLSFLRGRIDLENMNPIYKVPPELTGAKGLRDLTTTEIQKWESEIKETKLLEDKLK